MTLPLEMLKLEEVTFAHPALAGKQKTALPRSWESSATGVVDPFYCDAQLGTQ